MYSQSEARLLVDTTFDNDYSSKISTPVVHVVGVGMVAVVVGLFEAAML